MIYLLELKEKIKKLYNKYNIYVLPAAKFLLTLVSIILLNVNIGYMTQIKHPVIAVVVSVACAFLPVGFMVVALSLIMLMHLFAISLEFAAVALCVVALMYLLYFRYAPKQGHILVITVILCFLKLPYVLPVAVGLVLGVTAVIPVAFGIIIYYIIETAGAFEAAIANQGTVDSFQQVAYIVESLLGNRAWMVLVLAFAVAITVVYFIKKLTVDNAWTYAIISGTVVQFILLIVGKIAFSAKIDLVFMVIGTLLGAVLGYVFQVVFFSLDYKRTEYVQYEDDEYYYYVKAVPKINIADVDLQVKQINRKNTKKTKDISSMNKTERQDRLSAQKSSDKAVEREVEEEEDIFL